MKHFAVKSVITVFIVLFSRSLQAQTGASIDVAAPGSSSGYGQVSYNNPSALGQKSTVDIDYDDIKGSPFWNKVWGAAYLFLNGDKVLKVNKVKLNLYAGTVHYKDGFGKELVALENMVNRVVFTDKEDTAKVIAVFQKIALPDNKIQFCQVLNAGGYQLLKSTPVTIKQADYDVIAGKYNYRFETAITYYLLRSGNVKELKVLNKDELIAADINLADGNQWLNEHKNKLKSEAEVIDFLNYYNAVNQ